MRVVRYQRWLEITAASTVSAAEPNLTTGTICTQLNRMILPPKRICVPKEVLHSDIEGFDARFCVTLAVHPV